MIDKIVAVIKFFLTFFIKEKPEYDSRADNADCPYKIKRVAFYNGCEDNRSDRYRVYNIVNALREKKIIVDIYKDKSICYLLDAINYDVLIVFRENRYRFLRWKRVVRHLKRINMPVIYDTDDFTIEKENDRATRNILKIIKEVDAITVTTDYLKNQFRNRTGKKTYVIKNTINDDQLFMAKKIIKIRNIDDTVKIVYQSGTPTHNKDFLIAQKALLKILREYRNCELHIFGHLEISDELKVYSKQIVFHEYMDYLLLQFYVSEMDINIAPLQINSFNNSKSELKIFEAALLKIPTVCSPIPSYEAIIEQGENGYIAYNDEEWFQYLSELIEDKEKNQRMGQNAYNDFISYFYIQNEIEKVIQIYEDVCSEKKKILN